MTYYYGVVYFTNGEASLSNGFDSLEACLKAVKEGVAKHPEIVESTSYKAINSDHRLTTKEILGAPKSRDVMRDKKFLATL